ncbi:MAG: hypothetical protein E6X17_13250 [Sporomusaceae bacterium]|nr:hypothetical protein [Sporomusaceae bacterium]
MQQQLVQPGKWGVTNAQLIPAIKQAIQAQANGKLQAIKDTYAYQFPKAVRYLRKSERSYLQQHLT